LLTLALVLGSLAFARVPRANAAEDAIAVLPVEITGKLAASAGDLQDAVRKGLAISKRQVVGPDEPAAFRVSAQVMRVGKVFRVRLTLIRVADGVTIATENNDCDVADCSVAELVRLSARELVRQTIGRGPVDGPATSTGPAGSPPGFASGAVPADAAPSGGGASATGEAPGARASAAGAGPRPGTSPARTHGADNEQASAERTRSTAPARERPALPVLPLLGVGAGATAVGAGIAMLKVHDDCYRADCDDVYDTKIAAFALLGAGAVTTVVSALWLGAAAAPARPSATRSPQVVGAIGFGTVVISGRF
jgi:hypothetical protein